MATRTRGTTPPRKSTKPRGTTPTGSGRISKSAPSRTRPPGDGPRILDRNQLVEIIQIVAQSPVNMPDPSLDALADAAYKPRELVNAYYKKCFDRMGQIYENAKAQMPLIPEPNFDDIDPGF